MAKRKRISVTRAMYDATAARAGIKAKEDPEGARELGEALAAIDAGTPKRVRPVQLTLAGVEDPERCPDGPEAGDSA